VNVGYLVHMCLPARGHCSITSDSLARLAGLEGGGGDELWESSCPGATDANLGGVLSSSEREGEHSLRIKPLRPSVMYNDPRHIF